MTQLSDAELDQYAHQVMAHLEFHTGYLEPPISIQFELPEGHFLSVNDMVVGGRRVLYFLGYDLLPPNLARRVTAVVPRARRLPIDGQWAFGGTDRERRKTFRTVRHAVQIAYSRDTYRVPTAILIDPRQQPVRVEGAPGDHGTPERRVGDA
ncbi:MAG: hypothetical protein ACTHMQ_13130 [Protaetiibacter sp.]